MESELEYDEEVSLRDEDKTRRFVVPVSAPAIDDLGNGDDTTASALPPPVVEPFGMTDSGERPMTPEPPRAPEPRPRQATPKNDEAPMSNEPPKPPLPPIPGASSPKPESTGSATDGSSPTIVVKPIVHVPTPSRMQREATVVVKRAVRSTKRSPLAFSVLAAVVIVASAIAFVGIKRSVENSRRQEQIEQRIEQVRRQHAE